MREPADNASVCAPNAEVLATGIGYVRGWNTARTATNDLATRLVLARLDDGFGALKAEVNVHGDGLVQLGQVPADTVRRLTEPLVRGLCAEMDETPAAQDDAA